MLAVPQLLSFGVLPVSVHFQAIILAICSSGMFLSNGLCVVLSIPAASADGGFRVSTARSTGLVGFDFGLMELDSAIGASFEPGVAIFRDFRNFDYIWEYFLIGLWCYFRFMVS